MGARGDPGGRATISSADTPRIGCAAASCLIGWDARGTTRPTPFQVARVELATGRVLDRPHRAVAGGVQPSMHDVASDGRDHFVVWADFLDVFARRLSGAALADMEAAPITVSEARHAQEWPSAAFDGQDHVVAGSDERDSLRTNVHDAIWSARVSRAGVLRDGPPATGGTSLGA